MNTTIVLPWPDAALFPNRSNGKHWSTRQPAKEAARVSAFVQAMGHDAGDPKVDHGVTIIVARLTTVSAMLTESSRYSSRA